MGPHRRLVIQNLPKLFVLPLQDFFIHIYFLKRLFEDKRYSDLKKKNLASNGIAAPPPPP